MLANRFRALSISLLALACSALPAREQKQVEQRNLMIQDQSMIFMDAVAIASATTTVSSVYDGLAARLWGSGKKGTFYAAFNGVAPGGTSPTCTITLYEADDAAMSVNKTALGAVTVPMTSGTVIKDNWEISCAARVPRRYLRFEVVSGGTSPTFTVTIAFSLDFQTNPAPTGA